MSTISAPTRQDRSPRQSDLAESSVGEPKTGPTSELSRQPWFVPVLISTLFVVTVATLSASGLVVSTELILVALVPVAVFLVWSGKMTKLSAFGVDVVLREQVREIQSAMNEMSESVSAMSAEVESLRTEGSRRESERPNQHVPNVTTASGTSTTDTKVVGTAGREVTLETESSSDPDGSKLRYEWDPGERIITPYPSTTHTYQRPGEYTATVKITNDGGGTETRRLPVTIERSASPAEDA